MILLKLVPKETRINFVGHRRHRGFFAFSAALAVASVSLFLMLGLNYGIDFRGGVLMEVKTDGPADLAGMRSVLGGLGLGDVSIQEFGAPNDVLIRLEQQLGGETAQNEAQKAVRAALGDGVEYRRVEVVGPTVGAELIEAGIVAVVLAMISIMIYIWFRFEWQFSVGAIVALAHDVMATIGVFALLRFEFNLATVAAILTIAGYSINDTVVVYDRVRENLRKYKKMPLMELFNLSINNTLSRTVMTSVTTLLALLALYFLGGEIIRDFAFAMVFGVVIGTYSSICLAVPLLLYMNIRDMSGGAREGADEDVGQDRGETASV